MYFKPNTRIQYAGPVYQYPLYRMQYPVTQQLQYTRPNEQIPIKGHETKHTWRRYACPIYLLFFQCVFIVLIGIFGNYNTKLISKKGSTTDVFAYKYDAFVYASWMDVHSMMFVGFGFLMTFLKRYGYGAVGFNFLVAAFVIQWAVILKGWFSNFPATGYFEIDTANLTYADFSAAATLISFGAVIGKASPIQLMIMVTIEVVVHAVNQYIGLFLLEAILFYFHLGSLWFSTGSTYCIRVGMNFFFKGYDIGESVYVHAFGAYFGLAVSKVLTHKKIESKNEGESYNSNLFAMIGTVFLFVYWPSFNAAAAFNEGKNRAIVNTYLSIAASVVTSFIVSTLVTKGKLNMVHVQNSTLAGGVAVGSVANMAIRPYAAMLIGSIAGIISVLGYEYLTPFLKNKLRLHDTCGVHNLHGMPGVLSGITSSIVAACAHIGEDYGPAENFYQYYPSRAPVGTSNIFGQKGLGRTPSEQAGYQLAMLAVTLGMAIVSGTVTGFIIKLPFIEKIKDEDDLFNDEVYWHTPDDFLKND